MGHALAEEAWCPESHLQDPHESRKESTPVVCLLAATHILWHMIPTKIIITIRKRI